MSDREILIVAGEASGDRIAALVARALGPDRCFGVAGAMCRAAGVELVSEAAADGAMGGFDVVRTLPSIASWVARLASWVRTKRPRAAVLVNYTELNARLGRFLRARGTHVVWCVAPQVWAWRPNRIETLRGSFDRLAVLFPFEEALWRSAGHDATYVGHPSADYLQGESLDTPQPRAVAVLPGSRPSEVLRLASPLLEAARMLLDTNAVTSAAMILAPSLPERARAHALRAAERFAIASMEGDTEHGALPLLARFDRALVASGTAALEAALAGAAPVIAYKLDGLSAWVARRLVRTPHVGLPNVLLGRRAFPELLQERANAIEIAAAARDLGDGRAEVDALHRLLAPPSALPFGARVAELVRR